MIGKGGRGPSASSGVRVVALLLALRGRSVSASSVVRSASVQIAPIGRHVATGQSRAVARLAISARLSRLSVSPGRRVNGPGSSAGESVGVLPAVWLAFALPVSFIGKKAAALALARGEAWEVVGNALQIGGRVLIDAYGVPVFVSSQDSAAKLMKTTLSEAAALVGGISLPVGPGRDSWLSDQRISAAAYVKRYRKAHYNVGDEATRAAMVADLRFMELRV